MAEASNKKGNDAYIGGRFSEAIRFYLEADKHDQWNPKYTSNLSAAFYESGDYKGCLTTINMAWNILWAAEAPDGKQDSKNDNHPLGIKLATRYAKAKINAVQAGLLSLHRADPEYKKKSKKSKEIENRVALKIENFALNVDRLVSDSKLQEMETVWKQWKAMQKRCSKHTAEQCDKERTEAERRLRALPISKSPCDPALEFYRFGHDETQSIMKGILVNSNTDNSWSMDTKKYKAGERPHFSFLFGGSGDARHVFATIIHFADFRNTKKLDKPGKGSTAHFTLVDIHPATLARVIVMFALLHKILLVRGDEDKKKVAELQATLFYLYTSTLMPEYCREIIQDIAATLVAELPTGEHSISKGLHISEASLAEILQVLRYWSTPLRKTVQGFLQRQQMAISMKTCKGAYSNGSPQAKIKNHGDGEAGGIEDLMQQLMGLAPGMDLNALGLGNLGALGNLAALGGMGASGGKRKEISPAEAKTPINPYEDGWGEADICDHVKVLLPPKILLFRHPALWKLVNAYNKAVPESLWKAATKEVEEKWKPNPTLFDEVSTENEAFGLGTGYPAISGNPFDHIFSFTKFAKEFERGSRKGSPDSSFAIMSQFFELAAEAIWTLRDVLKIEIIVGDVMPGVRKLVAGDLGPRPKEFPTKFSRIDYTQGALNTAVYLLPYLENESIAIANCLLNTGLFKTVRDQIFTYALLATEDFPRFLGCRVLVDRSSAYSDIVLQAMELPRPIDELASKKELHTWLSRLLLCTLSNGKPANPPLRVNLPNTIQAFFNVLVHLHRVGFPAHWLGDYVQSLLSDNLVTESVIYEGELPVPPMFLQSRKPSRQVHLAAWRADFETIMASIAPSLPFSVPLPDDHPTFEDIKTLKVTNVDFRDHTYHPELMSLSTPFARSAALFFFKNEAKLKRDAITRRIPDIIEGHNDMKGIEVQFMLAPDSVDMRTKGISWRMTNGWYEKMKKEGWSMALYRSEMLVTVTEAVKAKDWTVVS